MRRYRRGFEAVLRALASSARAIPVAIGSGALAIFASGAIPHRALLVWNASSSAPIGLYLRLPEGTPHRIDLVLIRTPPDVAALAAARGYLPLNVPLIKRIVALSGDTVCAHGSSVSLNRVKLVERRKRDHNGRTMPHWSGCHRLARDEIFLAMTGVPGSFDGRYFGAIPASSIEGRLVPLWTE